MLYRRSVLGMFREETVTNCTINIKITFQSWYDIVKKAMKLSLVFFGKVRPLMFLCK